MIKPLRSPLRTDFSSHDGSGEVALTLRSQNDSVTITHDGFTIGSHRKCDLILIDPSIQPLHCVIHIQNTATWIESASDEITLIINERPCRRMSLRQDDEITFGGMTFTVDLGNQSTKAFEPAATTEDVNDDLASLSAEELCDRIVTEQAMIQELAEGEQFGWDALLNAIEAVQSEPAPVELEPQATIPLAVDYGVCGDLLDRIQDLEQTITARTNELAEHEANVMAASSALKDSQQRVAERIEEILGQLNQSEPANELRASA